jgi:Uncharacterized metal-binding protein
MPTITFQPSGRSIDVSSGESLLTACRNAGIVLSTPCAGKGFCGKCRVRVISGDIPADKAQKACLPEKLLQAGWRASCIARAAGDIVVADPADEMSGEVILSDFSTHDPCDYNTFWEKERVLEQPSTDDQRDDLGRLFTGLPTLPPPGGQPGLNALLRRLPEVLRAAKFRCRVLGMDDFVLDVVALDEERREVPGLAIDIGTTTIAVALCDARDGSVLSVASSANPQAQWGDDVISRIECASRGYDALFEMRRSVVQALEDLSAEACGKAGLAREPLLAAVAANTTMNHILLGVPPTYLAQSPFIPVFREQMIVSATELGWRGRTPPLFYIAPNISAYVGGDITAGIIAHGLDNDDGISLLVDIGTNGEIALSKDGVIHACSTAAGPAFEGARIEQGMRATSGAVSRVGMAPDGDLEIGVIDSCPAIGICGTGLLDAVAVLRGAGIIDETGRILDEDELEDLQLPATLLERVYENENGPAIRLSPKDSGSQVSLTQKDVREFQLAKSAIASGIHVLSKIVGIETREIGRVLLAGGFGNYLDPRSAVMTGLLPAGIGCGSVRPVGNAALAGARLCLLSPGERARAETLAKSVRHIELSGREDFQQAFAEEMLFPD